MGYKYILIVDDSATSRLIIKRCFEMAGYSDSVYYEAGDGVEAIELLSEKKVDLILSDIKMPKMDGLTFIRKIRNNIRTKNIPIVVISSIGENSLNQQFVREQTVAVIQKPISPSRVTEIFEGNSYEE